MILLFGVRLDIQLPWNYHLSYEENIRIQRSWFLQKNFEQFELPKPIRLIKVQRTNGQFEWYLVYHVQESDLFVLDFEVILQNMKLFNERSDDWFVALELLGGRRSGAEWMVIDGLM